MAAMAKVVLGVVLLLASTRAFAQITCPTAVTHSGTSANDDLSGTEGDDRIIGNGGQDTLRGLGGSDCIVGGSFNDTLLGGDGNDKLQGEGGNDVLDGGAGDDYLDGGSNKDTIIGGPGTDTLVGQGDDDTFIFHAGDVPAGQVEKIDGGSGTDRAVFDFNPGVVPALHFTVTDPITHGTYEFTSVEVVAINLCGNGRRDAGEDCDDGNSQAGDGCSATCEKECGDGAKQGSEE